MHVMAEHANEVCPSCGTVFSSSKRRCPNCGRPRAPRWPERGVARMALERAVPTTPMPGTSGAIAMSATPAITTKHYSRALPWIEFIAGCFGFHGVGLFLLGKRGRGLIWLTLSLIKHAIGAGLIVITLGFALACLIPLDVAISLYLATATWRAIRHLEGVGNSAGG
jgi:ribosomal protein L37E